MARTQRFAAALAIAVVALLYAAPFAAIASRLEGTGLVPQLDAHPYLYVASGPQPVEAGRVENPWYGNRLPAANIPYLRFGKAIVAYAALEGVVGPTAALPLWSAAVTLAIAALAYALSRHAL